jgi:hypothetical protein
MDTNTLTQPATGAPARLPRLGRNARRVMLVAHILSGGAWVGIDVIVAVLVVTGWFSDDTTVRGIAYQALGQFVVWPMLTAGLVCLVSGVVLGLGSKYGLVRYWWVAVKLVLNIVLCVLIVVALRPGMGEVVDHGRALAAGRVSTVDVTTLFFPPAVSLVTLSFATVLGVVKPWGRIRRSRRRDRR